MAHANIYPWSILKLALVYIHPLTLFSVVGSCSGKSGKLSNICEIYICKKNNGKLSSYLDISLFTEYLIMWMAARKGEVNDPWRLVDIWKKYCNNLTNVIPCGHSSPLLGFHFICNLLDPPGCKEGRGTLMANCINLHGDGFTREWRIVFKTLPQKKKNEANLCGNIFNSNGDD